MAVEMTEAPVANPTYTMPQTDGDVAMGELVELRGSDRIQRFENETYLRTGEFELASSYSRGLSSKMVTASGRISFGGLGNGRVSSSSSYIVTIWGSEFVIIKRSDGSVKRAAHGASSIVDMANSDGVIALLLSNGTIRRYNIDGSYLNNYAGFQSYFNSFRGLAYDGIFYYVYGKDINTSLWYVLKIDRNFNVAGTAHPKRHHDLLYTMEWFEDRLYFSGQANSQVPAVFSIDADESDERGDDIWYSSYKYPVFISRKLYMSNGIYANKVVDVVGFPRVVPANHSHNRYYVRIK